LKVLTDITAFLLVFPDMLVYPFITELKAVLLQHPDRYLVRIKILFQ
jgi:hypothetical protein